MPHIKLLGFCIWDFDTLLKKKKHEIDLQRKQKECFFFFFVFGSFSILKAWEMLGWEKWSSLMAKNGENWKFRERNLIQTLPFI